MKHLLVILFAISFSTNLYARPGHCGHQNQRPCSVFEAVPSCLSGLTESRGRCLARQAPRPKPAGRPHYCGHNQQRPCNVTEFVPACHKGLHEALGVCKQAQQAQKVNGYSVSVVKFSNTGKFKRIGKGKWAEYGAQGPRFRFTEKSRDEWSVYLHDASRNVNIQLDLHRKKVVYSVGNGARSDIYNIINAK